MQAEAPAILRPATARDLPAIVALWRESMALHAARDPAFRPRPEGHLAFGAFAEAQARAPDAAVVVAEVAGEVAAYGICVLRRRPAYFEPQEHGLVTDLDVAAPFRRMGLGAQVLDALCAWLRGRGIDRVEAEAVMANELSLGFWRKRGFAPYYQAMARRP